MRPSSGGGPTGSLRLATGDVVSGAGSSGAIRLKAGAALGSGLGGAVTLADATYLQSFFGVNSTQSAASGYAVYQPGAGLRDARTNVALTYLFNRHTSLTTGLSVSALQGDARDSPLVRQATTTSGVMVLSHAF